MARNREHPAGGASSKGGYRETTMTGTVNRTAKRMDGDQSGRGGRGEGMFFQIKSLAAAALA